jgi:hypothetical protein
MLWTQSIKLVPAICTKGTFEVLLGDVVHPASEFDNLTQQSLNRSVRLYTKECMQYQPCG